MFNGATAAPIFMTFTMKNGGDVNDIHIYNNTCYSASAAVGGSVNIGWLAGWNKYTNVYIKNNIFIRDGSYYLQGMPASEGMDGTIEIDHNFYYSEILSAFGVPGKCGNGYCNWAEWQALGYDANGIGLTTIPSFKSTTPASFDLSLRSDSPCIDKGVALGSLYNTDINGTERIGTAWDIGAYEYIETGPDTTAPSRSSASPSGALVSGTTQANISLTTNESATCKYSITPNTAYASMTNTFTTTGGISHSQTITGLTDDSSYNYYVRCVDTSNNVNTNDYEISFSIATVGPDTTPPTATISINNGSSKTNSQTTSLSISASDPSTVTEMKISNTNNFSSAATIAYTTVKEWVLTAGDGLKTVYAWFKDSVGNWNTTPKTNTIIFRQNSTYNLNHHNFKHHNKLSNNQFYNKRKHNFIY